MMRTYRCNFVKPDLQEVVNWVDNSWDKVTDTDFSNALRTVHLDKNYSYNDSYTTKNSRFGPMIHQEINLEQIGILFRILFMMMF